MANRTGRPDVEDSGMRRLAGNPATTFGGGERRKVEPQGLRGGGQGAESRCPTCNLIEDGVCLCDKVGVLSRDVIAAGCAGPVCVQEAAQLPSPDPTAANDENRMTGCEIWGAGSGTHWRQGINLGIEK